MHLNPYAMEKFMLLKQEEMNQAASYAWYESETKVRGETSILRKIAERVKRRPVPVLAIGNGGETCCASCC
uniref:Uncharacterized protein n=1 Tax=Cohnella candidum TaxID=2674991 RepID=A0A3G3K5G2_9BACL|nr:hypothetical protein EAV92_22150 [Cohnella candidum]